MEGEAAAAVLQTLVQNLIDLCKKEISQIRGLRKDAAKLSGNLDMIKNFLKDAETRTITKEAVKCWLKKLEDVVFDADNVLDEINYHILSKQINATKPLKAKVLSSFSRFKHISRSRNMALKIKEINENLESIKKEAAELHLVEKLDNEPTLVIASLETNSFTLDPIFIGRDDVKLEIVEKLTSSITTDKCPIPILAIVGMGGLGKTTLTRKVFNHEKMESRFGSRIWVHVSPNFDAITLFKKILKELTNQVEGESEQDILSSEQDILSKLRQALRDKTYLLVLDDVWNEDPSKWEAFINSLLGVSCGKRNAIVVTTRSTKVASVVNPIHTHDLEGLSEAECWSIIKVKTFGEGNVTSEFETIGRKIARRCKGSPLAANVVGGVLRIKSEEEWRSVEEKWLSAHEGGDNISNILRLSFDNLSLLKKCFSYCAMLPKGSKIKKQELIEMWMAENFLQADGRDDMESVGEKFIDVLLHSSLLQVAEKDRYGNVRWCVMHDLVHDLACTVSSSSNSTGGSSRVQYMTLGDNYCGDESSRIPKETAKSLRTLLIISKGDTSDINFSELLPSSIQKLIHLRDFDISKTRIEVLPDWIGEFFHLQTLRVDSGCLKKLPSTIKYLINLRHLYLSYNIEYLPRGIGRLTCLQTLKYFPVGDENGCKIEELGSLNNLKGVLEIRNLERVHDKEEAGKANLFKKSKILNLSLKWDIYREGERNDEDVLERLQPHSNLRELDINGFKGKRFPSWTQKMAVRDAPQSSLVVLNKLMSLKLWYCSECEEIPMLGHLSKLKSLNLDGWSNLKCINSSFYEMVNKDTRIVFPALERLELWNMPKLAEWAEIEISDGSEVKLFPRLRILKIRGCEQLMSVPSLVSSCLEKLEICEIGVEYLPADWLLSSNQTLSELQINDCRNLREISDRGGEQSQGTSFTSLPIIFPRLTHLTIRNCLQLMSVPSLVSSCLEKLKIYGIGVEYLPGDWFLSSNQTLSELNISECPNLREISDRGGEQLQGTSFTSLPIIFPRLTKLTIWNCKQLMSVPSLVLTCLEELEIYKIGVEYLSGDWLLSSNQTLSKLTIWDCPNLREISDRGGEQSQGRSFTSLPIFPRLTHLEIMFCEQLMSVPSLVSSCLEELKIYKIGVEYLPGDWFLSSNQTLSKLVIMNCPNLREISDRGGEQSQGRSFTSLPIIFPRLRSLKIMWCEQLMSVPSLVSSCLEKLKIWGIGVEYLHGDWFLSSNQTLSKLVIRECPNLRKISVRGGEQSQGRRFKSLPIFPHLTYLHIEDCPNLKKISDRRGEQSQGRRFISLPIFPLLTILIIRGVPKLNLEIVDATRASKFMARKALTRDFVSSDSE